MNSGGGGQGGGSHRMPGGVLSALRMCVLADLVTRWATKELTAEQGQEANEQRARIGARISAGNQRRLELAPRFPACLSASHQRWQAL